jgi:3',5'-cyclic-AMP phosphodiesterase
VKTLLAMCVTLAVLATSVTVITAHASDVPPDVPELTFSVISDIHLRAGISERGLPVHDLQAAQNFAKALLDINRINPSQDALVINGDLTLTGQQSDYDDMRRILSKVCHPPTLFTMGNHEYYAAYYDVTGKGNLKHFPNGVTEAQCIGLFLANTDMPSVYYDTWIKGYHFIVLGSERSRISNPSYGDGSYLSDTQLTWLHQKLLAGPPDKPVFVFTHVPLANTLSDTAKPNNIVIQSDKFVRALSVHRQVILFSGHTHRTLMNPSKSMYQNGFTLFNDSCVRNPLDGYRRPVGDSEGLYVQVYKDRVVVNGRDFTHKTWIRQYNVPVTYTPRSRGRMKEETCTPFETVRLSVRSALATG